MSLFRGVAVLLTFLGFLMMGLFSDMYGVRFYRFVPKDVLALIVINNPPSNLEFLNQTRLTSWFDVDPEGIRKRVPKRLREQISLLFQQDLESAWLLIHGATLRSTGAWRLHFSIFLIPRPRHREAVELRIELAVQDLFGVNEIKRSQYNNFQVYRGNQEGEILYKLQDRDFILISNSNEGWQKTLRTTLGKDANLGENTSFQWIKTRLRLDSGLFVYFRGDQLFPFLPEFGYSIYFNENQIRDDYYAVGVH